METAGKNIEDEQARALMKAENKGLGTAATMAAIINSLFAKGYLTKKGKSIIPTEKGIFLIDNLPVEDLKSAELTGQWEKRLHEISIGNDNYNDFITAIEQTVRNWYSQITSSNVAAYTSAIEQLFCPFCHTDIIKGKSNYFCSKRKETGCSFSVGFEICGKKITDEQFIKLIQDGKTSLIKGFHKKDSDKEFNAYLIVDKNQRKIKFEFPSKNA